MKKSSMKTEKVKKPKTTKVVEESKRAPGYELSVPVQYSDETDAQYADRLSLFNKAEENSR